MEINPSMVTLGGGFTLPAYDALRTEKLFQPVCTQTVMKRSRGLRGPGLWPDSGFVA